LRQELLVYPKPFPWQSIFNAPDFDNPSSEPTPESTKAATEPKPSYVKLAMRNMVRKGYFLETLALTTMGFWLFS